MEQKADVVLDLEGNAIEGASVEVWAGTGNAQVDYKTPATIYDQNGHILPNSTVSTGPQGDFAFSAPNGKYVLRVLVRGTVYKTIGPLTFYDPADDDDRVTTTELAAPTGAGLIGFKNGGTVQSQLEHWVFPEQYGAKGDGVTDDSLAIKAADTYAKSIGATLIFSGKTYLGYGLRPTAPWMSFDGATIKNNKPNLDYSNFVLVTSASGITSWSCENMEFDGSASADPAGGWSNTNHDSFAGSFGLFLYGLSSFSLRRVRAKNSANGAGIRIADCKNGILDRCETERTRGKYGDGIYIDGSSNIKVTRSRCSDFTRIGVVTEAGCYEIDISDTVCQDGHDASIKYGGTEYNAGFWSENTGSVRLTRCTSINTLGSNSAYRHFVNATGAAPKYPGSRAMHGAVQCAAYGYPGELGFTSYSLGNLPILMRREQCTVIGCDSAFVDNANIETDTFINAKCHAAYALAASGLQCAFQWNSKDTFTRFPLFEYESCTVEYTAVPAGAQATLDTNGSNTANFTCFTGGKVRLRILNCHNLDSTLPLYVKQNTGSIDLLIENGNIAPLISNAVNKARFKNVNVSGSNGGFYYINGSADFESFGSSFTVRTQIAVTGNIILNGGQVKMPNDGYLLIVRSLSSARPALQVNGVSFEKDIAAGDYVFRIQEQGAVKPVTVINGCVFYNSGVATSVNSFIWIVTPITAFQVSGTVSDNTVSNLYKLSGTLQQNPTGNTPVQMH